MRDWKNTIVNCNDTVLNAIESIERGVLQIALVVDNDNRLVGSVTDGDVRRAILKGANLNQSVSTVMNATPFRVHRGYDLAAVRETMLARRIHQVPVVDNEGRVIDLVIFDELVKGRQARDNWVVLMAGGRGSRLHPLTENTPKPLLKVGEKPLLEIILEKFVNQGFDNFFISINYQGNQIKQHFASGEKWSVNIRYLEEDRALGTAGALSLLPKKPQSPFIVMNADLMTDIDFSRIIEFHYEQEAVGTMGVRAYDFQVDFGVVEIDDGRISQISEKPVHKFLVNAGIYVLDPIALSDIPDNTMIDMPTLFEKWIQADRRCAAFPIHEYWLDVGRVEDLERAKRDVAERSH